MTREVAFKPGGRFFEHEGKTMFVFQIDSTNAIGPRLATAADKKDHAIEWRAFNQGRLPQLDHDGDGIPGGHAPVRPVAEDHKHEPADYEQPKRRGRPPKRV